MLGERRTLADPAHEYLLLLCCQRSMGVGRRHPFILGGREDADDEVALIRIAREDHPRFLLPLGGVEPQPPLARGGVLSVAMKTIVREDRPHIAAKVYRLGATCGQRKADGGQRTSEGAQGGGTEAKRHDEEARQAVCDDGEKGGRPQP